MAGMTTYGHDALERAWLTTCGPVEASELVVTPQVVDQEAEKLFIRASRMRGG